MPELGALATRQQVSLEASTDTSHRTQARNAFRIKVYSFDGQAYEDLFVQVMQYKNPDFRPVKPQGRFGDRKNDGFDPERGVYYQVFAPEDLRKNPAAAVKKAKRDFEGLRKAWRNIREFYFVINDKYRGVYPEIEAVLADIKAKHRLKVCEPLLAHNLEAILFSLPNDVVALVTGLIGRPSGISLDYEFDSAAHNVAKAPFIPGKSLPGEMTSKGAADRQRRYLQDGLGKMSSRQLAQQILTQVSETDKRLLAIVGMANILARVKYLALLFPDVRWRHFVNRMKDRGCVIEKNRFLQLAENLEEALFHRQEFEESARASWIAVLAAKADYWDLALAFCVHLLALKEWKLLIQHSHNMILAVEEAWVSKWFFDILSKIDIPKVRTKLDSNDKIFLLDALGTHYARQGRNSDALARFNKMLAIARSAGDVWGIGQALLHRSNAWLNAGKLRKAEQGYREAESWAREQGDDWLLGRVLNNLFYCLKERNADLGSQVIEESIQAKERSGDRVGRTAAYAARGILAADANLHRKALTWFRRAERIAVKYGDRYGQAQALHNQSKGFQALGRHKQAVVCQRRACEIAKKLGRPDLLELVTQGLAVALFQAGRYRAALPKFLDLYEAKLVRGDISGAVTALSDAGMMAFNLDDHATARTYFRKAMRIGFEHKKIEHMEYPILNLSALWMKEGKSKSALRFLSEQLDRLEDIRHWKVVIALAKRSINVLIDARSDPAKIEALWMRALAAAKKQKDLGAQIDLLKDRYAWIRDRGDTAAALLALKPLIDLTRRARALVEYLEALNEFSNRIQELGDSSRAEILYRAALSTAREIKSDRLSSIILNNLAETLRRSGRPHEAIPLYQEAVETDSDVDGRLLVEHNLALALDAIGETATATSLLERVRDRSRRRRQWEHHCNAWLALGDIALEAGAKRLAVSRYQKAKKVAADRCVPELFTLAQDRERQVAADDARSAL